jgi:hypothetical protein
VGCSVDVTVTGTAVAIAAVTQIGGDVFKVDATEIVGIDAPLPRKGSALLPFDLDQCADALHRPLPKQSAAMGKSYLSAAALALASVSALPASAEVKKDILGFFPGMSEAQFTTRKEKCLQTDCGGISSELTKKLNPNLVKEITFKFSSGTPAEMIVMITEQF